MTKKTISLYLFSFSSLLIILLTFWGLTKSFYQQDEWMTVGVVNGAGLKAFVSSYSLPQIFSGQGRALALPLTYLFFDLWAFKIFPVAVFAILLHFTNSILAFLVLRRLTKDNLISFISGLFFSVAFISHQSITWFAAVTTTLPAAFFALLSLLYYLKFLEDKKYKTVIFSSAFLIISLNFKESGLFLIIFYPLLYLTLEKMTSFSKFLRFHRLIIGYGLLTVFSRFSLVAKPAGTGVGVTDSPFPLEKIISHILVYPITSLSQVFLYPPKLYYLADMLQRINYPFINSSTLSQLAAQTITSEMISILVSLLIISLTLLVSNFYQDLRRMSFFALGFTLLASFPYVIFDKSTAYLETRFYYLIVFGGATLFGIFIEVVRRMLLSFKIKPIYALSITLIASFLVISKQSSYIRKDIDRDVRVASQRVNFLKDLNEEFPEVGKKTVFYIDGDTDYSGLKIPFQQGPGYTLMVNYFETGNIPNEFLASSYLWGMAEEGFRKKGDFAFGYYWDFNKLLSEIKKGTFSYEDVFSFYYRGKKMELVDTTIEVRKEIRNRLQ